MKFSGRWFEVFFFFLCQTKSIYCKPSKFSKASTVKILLNARAFNINNAFSVEGDGRLLEATLLDNIQALDLTLLVVLDLLQIGLLFGLQEKVYNKTAK